MFFSDQRKQSSKKTSTTNGNTLRNTVLAEKTIIENALVVRFCPWALVEAVNACARE
jgi:hypothetical protein